VDDPKQNDKNLPVFSDLVDRVVEFTAAAESHLAGWKYREARAGAQGPILSVVVDQFIEFTETAEPNPGGQEATQENKPASADPLPE
jgi:hypothetical protein